MVILRNNAMQVLTLFLSFAVASVLSAPIQPTWTNVFGRYQYQYPQIGPQYLQFAAYQDAYSPYVLYNVVHSNVNEVPSSVLASGKPAIGQVPTYSYFGTPVYDFRFPLHPIHVLTPARPGLFPRPTGPPTSTGRPSTEFDDDDGIEKLDMKVDPEEPQPLSEGFEDDDTVTIDAI